MREFVFSRPAWQEMLKENSSGFPGGSVVRSLPARAGDTGSIPGSGRSHMLWSPKPIATAPEPVLRTRELQLLKPTRPQVHAPQQERPVQREARTPQLGQSPSHNEDPAGLKGNKRNYFLKKKFFRVEENNIYVRNSNLHKEKEEHQRTGEDTIKNYFSCF